NLGPCLDVLDGAYDDLVAYRVGLGIGPARVICVASEVLSARSVNRPSAIDLVKISASSGFKFIGLLVREFAAFVFDNERSLLNWRCREKAQASAGTADTESSLAGHNHASTTIRAGHPTRRGCAPSPPSALSVIPGGALFRPAQVL